jgi:hypothetical protein
MTGMMLSPKAVREYTVFGGFSGILSMYHPASLQIVELLGEHFGRCAGDTPL